MKFGMNIGNIGMTSARLLNRSYCALFIRARLRLAKCFVCEAQGVSHNLIYTTEVGAGLALILYFHVAVGFRDNYSSPLGIFIVVCLPLYQ